MAPRFLCSLRAFRRDETGAVTIDWVVLTAIIVGLGVLVTVTVTGAASVPAEQIVTDLAGLNP